MAVIGMRLSGAETRSFRHNNLNALEAILRQERGNYSNGLVVIEGLYSTEGDVPDLEREIEIKDRYGACSGRRCAWLRCSRSHRSRHRRTLRRGRP